MDIFEYHQHRLPRCQALELRQQRCQRLLLAFLRAQLWQAVTVMGRQRQKVSQKCCRLVRVGDGLREQRLDLSELLRGRVAALEPGSPFELANEWEQRTVGVVC